MLQTLVRRLASAGRPALTIQNNPYKAKKVWPPDFSKLSPQEQLRIEKRYKRRLILATRRPRWDRFLRMVQFFSISGRWYLVRLCRSCLAVGLQLTLREGVIVYMVLFIDSDKPEGEEPFANV